MDNSPDDDLQKQLRILQVKYRVKEAESANFGDQDLDALLKAQLKEAEEIPEFEDDDPLCSRRALVFKRLACAKKGLEHGDLRTFKINFVFAKNLFEIIKRECETRWGQEHRIAQSDRAKEKRSRSAGIVEEIITSLAKNNPDSKPIDLWAGFFGRLNEKLMSPRLDETPTVKDQHKIYYTPDNRDSPTSISYERFRKQIRRAKNGK